MAIPSRYRPVARDTLFVSELFPSMQGEGPHAGQPAAFLRLMGCNLTCLVGSTRVRMRHGPPRPIARVQVGDEVLSWDGAALCYRRVLAVQVATAQRLVRIQLRGARNPLLATPDHLFRVGSEWRRADSLLPGEALFHAAAGEVLSFRRRQDNALRDPAVAARHGLTHQLRHGPALAQRMADGRASGRIAPPPLTAAARCKLQARMTADNPMHDAAVVAQVVASNRAAGTYARAAVRMRTLMDDPAVRRKVHQRRCTEMSGPERRLAALAARTGVPLVWVGDGRLPIGRRAPDFHLPNTNKVIEVYDGQFDYYGQGQRGEAWLTARRSYFAERGYETLFLDDRLPDDAKAVLLADFAHNGLVIESVQVLDAERPGKGHPRARLVYDLTVEDSHCFFVSPSGTSAPVLTHNCSWCDVPHTWNYKQFKLADERIPMRTDETYTMLMDLHLPRLVITGGEPLLQSAALGPLLYRLGRESSMQIELETNGTLPPPATWVFQVAQWNVSPKLPHSGNDPKKAWNESLLRTWASLSAAIFKFVCKSVDDVALVAKVTAPLGIDPNRVWIMPEGIDAAHQLHRTRRLVPAALAHGFNFSPRLQILAFGDERAR